MTVAGVTCLSVVAHNISKELMQLDHHKLTYECPTPMSLGNWFIWASKVKVTSHNSAGVGLCTLVSAVFEWSCLRFTGIFDEY